MQDYTLYYWSVPFRGQFVRAALAFAGKNWHEAGDDQVQKLMAAEVADMPIPFMGPPVLIDHANGFAISEMPAILLYLGDTLDLVPQEPTLRALSLKIVTDANDVIDELTLQGGQLMWTAARWNEFVPRLKKWMSLWEEVGRRHGVTADAGYLLGTDKPGIADVVTAVLWTTMAERFSEIADIFETTAPVTSALSRRVASLGPLRDLAAKARADYGDAYCGGEIEASLRKVADKRA